MRLGFRVFLCATVLVVAGRLSAGDWPTVRHDVERSGRTADEVRGPYTKRWVRYFPGEIMTTRMEAIVAGGRVFVGTYSGNLYSLDAETGEIAWKFSAQGAILHSPAVADGAVFFGCEDGYVRAVEAASGRLLWKAPGKPSRGGFCTSPAAWKGAVYMGGRNGTFYAFDARSGKLLWTVETSGPIRTTAACSDGRIVFASDDMHAYCVDRKGKLLWRSAKLQGQSLRDYYPVIIGELAVFRTNPVGPFAARHGADRHLLVTHAGVSDNWRAIAAFTRSDATRPRPEKLESERRAILEHLEKTPDARTFFALDLATGRERVRMPVLWGAGCQGVGLPPVLTNDGRAIVFYRSAYSNWSHGVAPIVAIGYLDFEHAAVEPIRHRSGNAPPWNTFWGTADESQNFSVGGRILYFCHQGTISGLDLGTLELFHIAGNRDTWGGEYGLPWARNEWHGPARGSAAIAGNRIYWLTGSWVVCVEGGKRSPKRMDKPFAEAPTSAVLGLEVPRPARRLSPQALEDRYVWQAPGREVVAKAGGRDRVAVELEREVARFLEGPRLAPLYVQPGLAGREFFFDSSADVVYALSLAYPHLSPSLRERVRNFLRAEIERYPLWDRAGLYAVDRGKRRELFDIPVQFLRRRGRPMPHPLGNLYALWLYCDRVGDGAIVDKHWSAIRSCYASFAASDWRFDGEKCDLFANRYIGGLIGYARLARGRDDRSASEASRKAASALAGRIRSFHADVGHIRLPSIRNVRQVGRFIARGNGLYCGRGHYAKIDKFLDLQPEIAAAVRDYAPKAAGFYLRLVDITMPGWYLAWEERQVHFGENFIDYPDQAVSIFRAKALLERVGRKALKRYLDLPWCAGDLFYIEKLVRILESP